MLTLSNHAVYRYAKRVFYQDVCDKESNLNAQQFRMVMQHASDTIRNIMYLGNGIYPLPDMTVAAVVEDRVIKTFIYKDQRRDHL